MGWVARFGAAALLQAVLLSGSASAQQGIEQWSVDRYRLPAAPNSGMALQSTQTAPAKSVFAQLAVGYQHEPLVLQTNSERRLSTPVEHRVSAYLSAMVGVVDNLSVFVQLPLTLYQDGDFAGLDKFVAEDLVLGAQGRFVGDGDGFSMGINAALVFPTGNNNNFASDDELSGRATLLIGYDDSKWGLGLNFGAEFRPARTAFDFRLGSDLLAAFGIYVRPLSWFRIGGEIFGATGISKDRTFTTANSHVETALSLRFERESGTFFQLAGSLGIARGVGTPTGRALLTVGARIGGN